MKKILLALILFSPGCWWGDDEDRPYIDPDARGCCRCIGDACPDGGSDGGDDASE